MAGMIDESMDTNINYKSDEFQSKTLFQKIWVLSAGSYNEYSPCNNCFFIVGL